MLGISHQGADIDALCIAPCQVTRQNFFKTFFELIQVSKIVDFSHTVRNPAIFTPFSLYFLQYQEEVTELRAIEEAFVPVIKFRYNGIEIDMTFARTNMNTLPESKDDLTEALLHLSTMEAMEAKCIRSLNGYRSTMELLKIVSDKEVCQTIIFFGSHFENFECVRFKISVANLGT